MAVRYIITRGGETMTKLHLAGLLFLLVALVFGLLLGLSSDDDGNLYAPLMFTFGMLGAAFLVIAGTLF